MPSETLLLQLIPQASVYAPQSEAAVFIEPQALSKAVLSTYRMLDIELSLNYAGSQSIGSSGSVSSVRGNTTIANGTTVTAGFVYGTQGKLTIQGELDTANWSSGIVGQVDLSAGTHPGSGHLSAIWGDMGGTAVDTSDANASVLLLTNTTADKIDAAIFVDTNSNYFMDLTDEGGGHGSGNWIISSAVGATNSAKLKVNVNGTAMYIPLYTS